MLKDDYTFMINLYTSGGIILFLCALVYNITMSLSVFWLIYTPCWTKQTTVTNTLRESAQSRIWLYTAVQHNLHM